MTIENKSYLSGDILHIDQALLCAIDDYCRFIQNSLDNCNKLKNWDLIFTVLGDRFCSPFTESIKIFWYEFPRNEKANNLKAINIAHAFECSK